MLCESGINTPAYSSDDIFDNVSLTSRSNMKLTHSPPSNFERRPVSVIHHAPIRTPSLLDSPSISSTSSSTSAKFVVQTTSFPNSTTNDRNIPPIDRIGTSSLSRQHTTSSTGSTGFLTQQRSSAYKPVVVQKQLNDREESPLSIVDNPLFQQFPPRKPPRTFQHENRYDYSSKTIDQKVPSSSSSASDSPTFDLGKFICTKKIH